MVNKDENRMRECPICGSRERHNICSIRLTNFDGDEDLFDNQEIESCEFCGFVYHDGMDFSKFQEHYGTYTSKRVVSVAKMTPDEEILNNNMADFVQYHIKTDKDAAILDVGCGYAWVISLLEDRGFTRVSGIDTDVPLVEELNKKYNISAGDCESDIPEFESKYDVVIIKMVMEHLEHPQRAIENMRKWLKDGGVIVIEVPDCSKYPRTAFFPGYFQSVNMEHINNYSPISMLNLMRDWEFVAAESTDTDGIFPVLRMAFRKCNNVHSKIVFNVNDEKQIKHSIDEWSLYAEDLRTKIQALSDSQKEIAVWGVSAFTRGLLTYTALRDCNIAFFVDRSADLQKKTLLSKMIVPSSELLNFDGVIVIPGKTSKGAILGEIKSMGLENDVICLS